MMRLIYGALIIFALFFRDGTAVRFLTKNSANEEEFIIEVNKPSQIEEARSILAGEHSNSWHIGGTVVKSPAPYNPGWSFHVEPNSIQFGQAQIEVCDATAQYVEENLDEACGHFLPWCFWCPWLSYLVEELED